MLTCSKCPQETPEKDRQFDTVLGLKRHMSRSHGGWDLGDLQKSGYEPTAEDVARNISGKKSSAEVSAAAPDAEQAPATKGKKRGQKEPEPPEVAEAKHTLLLNRCKLFAQAPWKALSILLKDERLALDKKEAESIAAAYVTLAEYKQWQGDSAFFIYLDAAFANIAAAVGNDNRRQALKEKLGLESPEEKQARLMREVDPEREEVLR